MKRPMTRGKRKAIERSRRRQRRVWGGYGTGLPWLLPLFAAALFGRRY